MAAEKVGKKIAVSVMFDTVKLEVICGDDYEAQVLYDDLIERLRSGEGISLSVLSPKIETAADNQDVCRKIPMNDSLENLAVRMAALAGLRWNELADDTKDHYRYRAGVELVRRKREAEQPYMPTRMPPFKFK